VPGFAPGPKGFTPVLQEFSLNGEKRAGGAKCRNLARL